MKVYITKYALTLGIQEREVREGINGSVVDSIVNGSVFMPQTFHIEGKGWHRTIVSAKKEAERMRASRIKALEKQIEKLKELKFT